MRGAAPVLIACALACEAAFAQQHVACDAELAALMETVQDRQTRVPLASAMVSAVWPTGSTRVRTDSAGRALLCAPPGRPIAVRVSYRNIAAPVETVVLQLSQPGAHTILINAPNALLRGTVLDHVSGQPVAQADVRLAHTPLRTITDSNGRFVFSQVPVGDYTLRVEHISYAAVASPVQVGADDLSAEIQLLPEAIPLKPVTVTAFSVRLERAGFYERQRRGVGTFLDRRQIDRMNVLRASDLLRSTPGTRIVPQSSRRNAPPNAAIGRGSCRYKIIVDGTRTLNDFEMDFVAPYALEGVEIYRGLAEVPAEFRAIAETGAGMCGVIALWTRDRR